MKQFIFAIMLTIPAAAHCQDSTAWRVEQTQRAAEYMRANLAGFQPEYTTGLTVAGMGAAAIIAAPHVGNGSNALTIVGGVLSAVGVAIVIDSHKHISRSTRWTIGPNGFTVTKTIGQ